MSLLSIFGSLLILFIAAILFMFRGDNMPHKTKASDIINLDVESLKILGRVIGQAIVEELLKHKDDGLFIPSNFGGPASTFPTTVTHTIEVSPPGAPRLDTTVFDVGATTEGIETKFNELASNTVREDKSLSDSKNKLAKLKKKEK
jgi:hypothetical protein